MTTQSKPKAILVAVLLYLPAALVLTGVAIISKTQNIPASFFMRDAVQILNVPFYVGLVSYLGIFLWCASVTLALFGSVVTPKTPEHAEQRRFLRWTGIITLGVMLDDWLIFHDKIFPDLFHTYEQVSYFIYLAVGIVYFLRFRKELFRADTWLLIAGFLFMATSLTFDQCTMLEQLFGRTIIPECFLLEDGAKLFAQVSWLGYIVRRAAEGVRGR
jgi:hypothetical protein